MKFKMSALLLSSAVLLGACGGNGSADSSDDNSKSNNTDNAHKSSIALKDVSTDPKDAIKKAQNIYKDEKLKKISFEKEHGDWAYKVEQQNAQKREESEVVINDKDKKVASKEKETDESNSTNKEFDYNDMKSYKDAIKAGQKKFDGEIGEWSLHRSKDRGKFVYDMDLKKGKEKHEITVDAKTGKVLSDERDD